MFSFQKSVAVVAVMLLVCMTLVSDVFAGDKVAFVNIDKLFDAYQKTLDLNEKLDADISARQLDREKMVEAIRRMNAELVLLTDDNKKEKQDEIDAKIRDLQGFDEKTREDLSEKRNDYIKYGQD